MNQRNYSLDLLRYLAMYGVVLAHAASHWCGANIPWLEGIGTVLFLMFPLITGYTTRGTLKVSKIVLYWIELMFYSIAVAAVDGSLSREYFSPLTSGFWWYATVYFMVMFFLPLFKEVPDKKTQFISLTAGFMMFSVLPVLTYSPVFDVGDGMSFVFILFMVYAGRCLREWKSIHWSILATVAAACISIDIVINQSAYYQINSPYLIVAAVCIFAIVKDIPCYFKIDSSCVWAVYLLHCHPIIWQKLNGMTFGYNTVETFKFSIILFISMIALALPFTFVMNLLRKGAKAMSLH